MMASNHIGALDPPIVGTWTRRTVWFLAKEELFSNPIGGFIMRGLPSLPLKRGVFDREAVDVAEKKLAIGDALVIFPEGTRSKTKEFLKPKRGIGMLALRYGGPIIPCYIHGSNRLMDCFLGRAKMSVTYGKPIEPSEYMDLPPGKESFEKIAQMAMERIGELRDAFKSLSN